MKQSAGLLVYNILDDIRVLLVHPGGPFFKNKDKGAWSIPKGEYNNEEAIEVAKRELWEETGNLIKATEFIDLGSVRLKSGKIIKAWAAEASFEHSFIRSNTFEMEWPPRSGKIVSFPEVDRAEWFTIEQAKEKIHPAQVAFIDKLELTLRGIF